jgi:hypothetical protein
MRFHMTHVTLEFHRVHPKRFLSLWYVRRKPCNYLASSLALSPIRLNRASTWALTPRSTIGCVQNNFSAFNQKKILCLRYVWRKPCTYLSLTPTLCSNGLKRDSTWPTWPWSSIGCVQNDFLRLWYVRHKPCTYLASRLALYSNGLNRAATWALSPRSTIVCIQNDF